MEVGSRIVKSEIIDSIDCVKLIKTEDVSASGWNFVRYENFERNKIKPSTEYILSFEVKSNKASSINAYLIRMNGTDCLTETCKPIKGKIEGNDSWVKLIFLMKTYSILPTSTDQVIYLAGFNSDNGAIHYIRNLMLEEGNILTDWSPSPEDFQNQIDNLNKILDKHLQKDGIFYINGNSEFAFFEQQKENIRNRLQLEHTGELKIYKSTDRGVSFPQSERVITNSDLEDLSIIPKTANTFNYIVDTTEFKKYIDNFTPGVYFGFDEELKNILGGYWTMINTMAFPDNSYCIQFAFSTSNRKGAYRIKEKQYNENGEAGSAVYPWRILATEDNTFVCFGMNEIPDNYDLNDCISFGSYCCRYHAVAPTLKNCPVNSAFTMRVYSGNGNDNAYLTQEITTLTTTYDEYTPGIKYIRLYDGYVKNWSTWTKILTDQDINNNSIHEYNIDNEYLSCYLAYTIKAGFCSVMIRGIKIKKTGYCIVIKDDMPRSYMDNHIPVFNSGAVYNYLGNLWLDRNTTSLHMNIADVNNGADGYSSFSYIVN